MSNLIIKQTKNGKGVFANRHFKHGELIIEFKGNILKEEEIEYNSYEDYHCIQIGEKTYIGSSKRLDDFINHSCNPNSGIKFINSKLLLIAIKNIHKGKEITFDYSTSQNELSFEMRCNCKSKICRRIIKNFKYLPKKIQQKYIKLGIVPKWTLKIK